jgi:redox-sensitive bicupin YhaK (pirin superfamily)
MSSIQPQPGDDGQVIEYRLAADRFLTRDQGRTTWHSFSFGSHYDPGNVGFARLVALNDERLPAGTGYADHAHADVEIVSWVLSGSLRHTSTVGSGEVGPGQVQRLSAGAGVRHSEVSGSGEETRFLQAWVRPDQPGRTPDYVAAEVDLGPGWTCVADGAGRGVIPLGARGTSLHVADLGAGERLDLPDARRLHVMVTGGLVLLGERTLADGDAARLVEEGGRAVTAESAGQVLVWAFAD